MTRAERSGGRNRPATGKTEPKGPEVTGGFLDSPPVKWYGIGGVRERII